MHASLPVKPPGHRALRRGRHSIAGQSYLITLVCADRQTRFSAWSAASRACAALAESRLWRDSRLLCWVLMPDHWHGLVRLGESEPLPTLIGRMKCITARAVNDAMRTNGPLWMPAYHDRALRRDQDLQPVARYIVANPVRAGIAASVRSYPYWDAMWLDEQCDLS